MSTDPIIIASYARTPMGGMQGALASVPATKLGSIAIAAAVARHGSFSQAADQLGRPDRLQMPAGQPGGRGIVAHARPRGQ